MARGEWARDKSQMNIQKGQSRAESIQCRPVTYRWATYCHYVTFLCVDGKPSTDDQGRVCSGQITDEYSERTKQGGINSVSTVRSHLWCSVTYRWATYCHYVTFLCVDGKPSTDDQGRVCSGQITDEYSERTKQGGINSVSTVRSHLWCSVTYRWATYCHYVTFLCVDAKPSTDNQGRVGSGQITDEYSERTKQGGINSVSTVRSHLWCSVTYRWATYCHYVTFLCVEAKPSTDNQGRVGSGQITDEYSERTKQGGINSVSTVRSHLWCSVTYRWPLTVTMLHSCVLMLSLVQITRGEWARDKSQMNIQKGQSRAESIQCRPLDPTCGAVLLTDGSLTVTMLHSCVLAKPSTDNQGRVGSGQITDEYSERTKQGGINSVSTVRYHLWCSVTYRWASYCHYVTFLCVY
ncbi:hypothetical protein J6590_028973 [Homalodisca vitripennis]|nr:hypothetical protein J6590_028973 [Homalodisca vitripennis]